MSQLSLRIASFAIALLFADHVAGKSLAVEKVTVRTIAGRLPP
jgi:hypothetical protein